MSSTIDLNFEDRLFVIIVTAARYNIDSVLFHVVNKTIFFIDAPAVFTMKISQ